jgi:uncharacterized RDD family membrane protein YckC
MEEITPSPDEQLESEDFLSEEEASVNGISQEIKMFEIAGFWRRFLAFTLDGFILGIPLIIIGFVFRDIAFSLGPWGRLIGYGIIFLYWSYFNSILRNGQTIGKKLMKTAVVDSNGAYLSLGKSMLRAGVLASIGLLNQWPLPILQNPVVDLIAVTIIFGGGLALLYGLIFNRKTRQGIHDLIAGSYVVKAPPNPETIVPATPRIHKRITIGLVGVGLILGLAGFFIRETNPTLGILEPKEWQEIQELQSILSENDEFFTVGVQRLNRRQVGSSTVMKDLNIDVWVKKSCGRNPEYCDELLKQIARTAFENYDDIDNLTGMRITLSNRFDLGLAKGNLNRGAAWTIEDWRKQLE